jgi:nucleoside-diphosphate-sugar epimerase
MKIFVTGVNGYIGSKITQALLEKGHQVLGLDVISSNIDSMINETNFHFIKADIKNVENIGNETNAVEVLIHCAALVHRRSQDLSKSNYFKVNTQGTINILAALNHKKLKQIIFLSTVSVYGEGNRSAPANENTSVSPVDFYGQSKAEAENYIMNYSQEKGINFTIFRLTPVYGKDFLMNLKKRVCLGSERFFFRIDRGNQKMSLCSVNNVIDVVTSSIGNEACFNEIFILSDRNNYQANEVIDAVKKILRRTKKRTYLIPLFLPEIALHCLSLAAPNAGKSLRYHFGKIATDCVYSGDKLRSKGLATRWNLMNTLLDPAASIVDGKTYF